MTRFFPSLFVIFFIHFLTSTSQAQQRSLDSLNLLKEVVIKAHLTEQPLLRLTTSVGVVDSALLSQNLDATLLPALNSIPGLRMEERSPGSFRLSLRGSLLRSPFGVRNVKVYFDEMPLTDAGGNTYLNAIDAGSMHSINILKGPDGSLFGANSGGVIQIQPKGTGIQRNQANVTISRGSYASTHQQFNITQTLSPKYGFSIHQSFQDADGYREHSAMKRNFFQTVQRWNYSPRNELRLVAFYSDLRYQTPGGLTEKQYAENPKAARPAAGPNPGAVEQQARILNKTLFGGLIHDMHINNRLKHVFTVFGSHTDFKNPFITNYELRDEKNGGLRTYFTYRAKNDAPFSWQMDAGMELQTGSTHIQNFDNNQGIQGAEQATDDLRNGQHFYFTRFSADIKDRFFIEASASLNYNHFSFRERYPVVATSFSKLNFDPEWMPRLAFSYLVHPQISWRASVARGYSPPTTAEVRSSDNIINTLLQAETGWNYETGIRLQSTWVQVDVSLFQYQMKDAIIRQLRDNGAEFFHNAGATSQKGIEMAFSTNIIQERKIGFIRKAQFSSNLTLSQFKFKDYLSGENDFSGNKLTGVPSTVVVSSLFTGFPFDLGLFLQHNYTSSIPLNDGNTVFAKAYHLVQAKVSWSKAIVAKTHINVFAGVDNLLNEAYSLGNDINAFGGRYFNAAPSRNYVVGIGFSF